LIHYFVRPTFPLKLLNQKYDPTNCPPKMPISNGASKETVAFLKRFQINSSRFPMAAMTSEDHYPFHLTVTSLPTTIMTPTFSVITGHVSTREAEEKTLF
jgi:hypothetical protein